MPFDIDILTRLHGFVRAVFIGDYQVVELLKPLTPCIDKSRGAMQHDTGGRMRFILPPVAMTLFEFADDQTAELMNLRMLPRQH